MRRAVKSVATSGASSSLRPPHGRPHAPGVLAPGGGEGLVVGESAAESGPVSDAPSAGAVGGR